MHNISHLSFYPHTDVFKLQREGDRSSKSNGMNSTQQISNDFEIFLL